MVPSRRHAARYNFNLQWELDYLFIEVPAGGLCLVCGSMVTSVKKFNVERHYKTLHVKEYGHIMGDDRVNLLNMLKEDVAARRSSVHQETTGDPSSDTQPVPGTSQMIRIAETHSLANEVKKPRLIPKTEPVDYAPESSVNNEFSNLTYPLPDEDEYTIVGKRLAYQLRAMSEEQRLLAEKIISEVMYYGRVGKLAENSFQYRRTS